MTDLINTGEESLYSPTEDSIPHPPKGITIRAYSSALHEELAYCSDNSFDYVCRRYRVCVQVYFVIVYTWQSCVLCNHVYYMIVHVNSIYIRQMQLSCMKQRSTLASQDTSWPFVQRTSSTVMRLGLGM